MRDEIVVAVVDTGVDYAKLKASVRDRLYRNAAEIPGNGRDDDGNGLVDDVTGPSTGPASNRHYQAPVGGHGSAMVSNVAAQIEAAEGVLGAGLPVSVMPVSMYDSYYANVVLAAEAGARVISLSHDLDYAQKAVVSELLRPFDAIAVTVDRDPGKGVNPDAGEGPGAAFDNVIEVALISQRVVRGNGGVDLLEVGRSLNETSESHAIANVSGKIAAIWAVDPSRSAAQVLEIVAASTTDDHPVIGRAGLSSEMGGQIDLAAGIGLAQIEVVAPVHRVAPSDTVDACVRTDAPGDGAQGGARPATPPVPDGPKPDGPKPEPDKLAPSAPAARRAVSAESDAFIFEARDVAVSGGRGSVTLSAADLLANDRGAGTISVRAEGEDGDVTLSRDGATLTYAFDLAGFDGRDAFTYRLLGTDGSADHARVYLRIATEGLVPEAPAAQGSADERVLAINVGSDRAHVSADGTVFAADTTGVGRASTTRAAISGTHEDALYRSGVWSAGGLSYDLDVEDGAYAVRLHFAETWSGAFADGVRVFDVAIEGRTAFAGLDVHAAAGARAAHVVEHRVEVADGRLDIDLLAGRQNPTLSAIEVVRLDDAGDDRDGRPLARDDAFVFDWETDVVLDERSGTASVHLTSWDLMENDEAGEMPQIEIVDGPADAVLGLAGEASVMTLVMDAARFDGRATFTYRVLDDDGAPSDPARVSVELRGMPERVAPPVTLALADAGTDRELVTLGASTVVEADSIAGRQLTVLAAGGAGARSARLSLDGAAHRIEEVKPYAFFGDRSGDLEGGLELSRGRAVALGAELFAGASATGASLGRASAALSAEDGVISGGRYRAPDVFAFDETRMGEDRVLYFEAIDRIALFGDSGLDAQDVIDLAREAHGDTLIDFGGGNVLTLQGFTGLAADDILL